MNLLALDQASRVSGYAIFIEGKLTKYGKFSFDDEDFGIRLMKIRNKVQEIIKEYSINQVIFEDIQL
jgi:Holliday junction resolvasome RuvABC endonuclease subunit